MRGERDALLAEKGALVAAAETATAQVADAEAKLAVRTERKRDRATKLSGLTSKNRLAAAFRLGDGVLANAANGVSCSALARRCKLHVKQRRKSCELSWLPRSWLRQRLLLLQTVDTLDSLFIPLVWFGLLLSLPFLAFCPSPLFLAFSPLFLCQIFYSVNSAPKISRNCRLRQAQTTKTEFIPSFTTQLVSALHTLTEAHATELASLKQQHATEAVSQIARDAACACDTLTSTHPSHMIVCGTY